jgi:hypothetical protein
VSTINNLKNMYLKFQKAVLLVVVVVACFACGSKKEDHDEHHDEQSSSKEWKEMDEFHMVMAETFHPFKDSANLEPAKAKASELAASAEQWKNATLPEKMNRDDIKGKLEGLKNETASFVQTVAGNDEKAIGDQLTKIHDLFHEIQEEWYGGEGHKHH